MIAIIDSIVHSGRKGVRLEPVTDPKYNGLLGCKVTIDFSKLKQFCRFDFDVIGHREYDWWSTSEVLEVAACRDRLLIETANALYTFKAASEDDEEELWRFRQEVLDGKGR